MIERIKIVLSLAFLTTVLGACGPRPENALSIGAKNSAYFEDPAGGATTAKKVRVRENDGKKVFEYLDPRSTEESWLEYGIVETLPKGTQLHHWGPKDDVAFWAANGIRSEDIDKAVRTYDGNDIIGGGFYVSLSPIDSSAFGPALIIAEPQNEVLTLNVSRGWQYVKEMQQLIDSKTGVGLPVPLVAESGIETLRYNGNWMVCIRGNPLTNLFEGTWKNFAVRYGGAQFDFKMFLTFEEKYPLNQTDIEDPNFSIAFPLIARQLRGEDLTVQELDELRKNLFKESLASYTPQPVVADSSVMKPLHRKIYDEAFSSIRSTLKLIDDGHQPAESESKLIQLMGLLDVKLVPQFPLYPQGFNIFTISGGVSLKPTSSAVELNSLMTQMNFYNLLNKVLKGTALLDPLTKSELPGTSMKLWSIKQYIIDDPSETDSWEKLARAFQPAGLVYRSAPLLVTGLHFVNGMDKPGFFKLSDIQIQELRDNLFLTPVFAQTEDASGTVQHYVYYETPSLKNAEKFLPLLNVPDLTARIKSAKAAGLLEHDETKEFRELNQELMKEMLRYILRTFKSPHKIMSLLYKLIPFQNAELNDRVLGLAYSIMTYNDIIIVDPGVFRTATYAQMIDHSFDISAMNWTLYRTLKSDKLPDAKVDLSQDIGFWELAANRPGPHADNRAFIDKVSARFKSADVQQYLAEGRNDLIMQALHEAGADQ